MTVQPTPSETPAVPRRVLLKLSGEVFGGGAVGLDLGVVSDAFSWVMPKQGEPQKEYRLTKSGYADLEEWERDIAVRKRHF